MKSILSMSIIMIVMSTYLFADKDVKTQDYWSNYYSKDPNLSSCTKGDLLDASKQVILQKVNSIRALHNLKPVIYEPSLDAPASEAALMMAKNEQLNHTPPNSWPCWSQTGYNGADHTNLFISWQTPSQPPSMETSILNWMIDYPADVVGHRRWIIDPFLKRIAIGRADGLSNQQQGMGVCSMALYVIDLDNLQDVSDWQINYVGYPYQYYSPEYVFFQDGGTTKWNYLSFTYVADKYNFWNNQNVDLTSATVTMTDENGKNIGISSTIHDNEGYGVPNCLKWMPTELNKEVKYTVKITGVKYSGQSNDFEYWFKLTDNVYSVVPENISQIAPSNKALNVPANTAFSWVQNNNAIKYQIQVSKKSDMSDLVINNQDLTTYGFQPTQPLPNNITYYWKVRGWNDAGFGKWSDVWSFTTGASAPTKPVLLSPDNGELKAGLKPLLTWNSQTAAESYDILISETSGFDGWNVKVSENVTEPKYQVLNGDLTLDTKYYWKVQAKNANGTSDWSDVWTFTTGTSINANVTLLEPANAAKDIGVTPLMKWNAVANASGYDLQISEGDLFTSIKVSKTKMSENEYQVLAGFLDPNVEYSWRVRAYVDDANGPWSEVWHFTTVKDVNKIPALLTPADSALNVPLNQEFSWGGVTDAASYDFQVSEKLAFDGSSLRINDSLLTSRFYTANGQLKDKMVYWWRVRAVKDKYTTYPWSYTRVFSTYDKIPHDAVLDKLTSIEISVYPNPSVQMITFDMKLINNDNITIIVFDESGKILKTPYSGMLSAGNNKVNLNVSDLPSGNYNYCIFAGDGCKYGKFMVTK